MSLALKKDVIQNDPASVQAWIDSTVVNSVLGVVPYGCSFILIIYT